MSPRNEPSQAQTDARRRNWRIRNLRALYALAHQLSGSRREAVHALIDAELELIGAEPCGKRRERDLEAWKQAAEPKCLTCRDGFACPENMTPDGRCPACGGDVIPF